MVLIETTHHPVQIPDLHVVAIDILTAFLHASWSVFAATGL
jgi:hypothetical protein